MNRLAIQGGGECALAGKSACFTGALLGCIDGEQISREHAQVLATDARLEVLELVTKKLDILVGADPLTLSTKAKKAREYGTRIVAEMAFCPSVWLWTESPSDLALRPAPAPCYNPGYWSQVFFNGRQVMNPWKVFAGCGLVVAFVCVAATAQDNKKKADNRPAQELANLVRTVEVAQRAYQKLQLSKTQNSRGISDEDLSGASLAWLKAEMRLVTTKADAIRVTSEYLQREGLTVGAQAP